MATGRDQSTLGLDLSEYCIEVPSLSAWPALVDALAGRGAALVPALGDHVARVVGMRGRVVIAFFSGYYSGYLA